jgi:hypothetical protein
MSGAPEKEPVPEGVPLSVVTVALLQLVGALPVLFYCGITLWGAIRDTREIRSTPIIAFVFGAPFCLAIVAVIASVGLLGLKEWGRRASLWMITLSTLSCLLFLILYHPQVAYGLSTIDDPYDISRPIAKFFLVALLPVTIYYWLLFNSEVSSRFGSAK